MVCQLFCFNIFNYWNKKTINVALNGRIMSMYMWQKHRKWVILKYSIPSRRKRMESYLDFLNWTSLISLRWWFLANIFSISVLSFFSLLYRFFSISTDNSNLYKSFIRAVLYFQFQWRGLELNRYRGVWGQYPENWRIYFHLFSSQEF